MSPPRLDIVILGLSITSSWGNGHATTYRGLVQALVARGHDVLFLERDVPWYAEARDLPSDERLWPFERAQELRLSWFGQHAMIGTPDQVARKLERFRQERHCTHFIMATQLPGLDPRKGTRSLELFAREIMPQLRRT